MTRPSAFAPMTIPGVLVKKQVEARPGMHSKPPKTSHALQRGHLHAAGTQYVLGSV